MLAKGTHMVRDKDAPDPGPCGGTTIWSFMPRRHWCEMTEADVAMHLLSGHEIKDVWNPEDREDAWINGTLVLSWKAKDTPDSNWEKNKYYSVVLHSKCRWKKKK